MAKGTYIDVLNVSSRRTHFERETPPAGWLCTLPEQKSCTFRAEREKTRGFHLDHGPAQYSSGARRARATGREFNENVSSILTNKESVRTVTSEERAMTATLFLFVFFCTYIKCVEERSGPTCKPFGAAEHDYWLTKTKHSFMVLNRSIMRLFTVPF